jgi:enterochelin esterase-like enzyme
MIGEREFLGAIIVADMLPWKSRPSLAILFFAAACTQPTSTPIAKPVDIVPTIRATEILPTATRAAVPTAADDEGCQETAGQIIQAELVGPELPRSLPYRIYIPPCAAEAHGQLPTLYLLHGLARTDAQWDEIGADEVAHDLVAAGRAPLFLIVMPWQRLGLEYEQTIVEHLIPHIESEYGASPDQGFRSIGGISRGAGWALRIGLQHPELFTAIGLHSPAVLVPDIYELPNWIESIPAEAMPEIWIDIGDRDPLRFSLPELTDLFNEADVSYVFRSYPGEHIEAYWAEHIEDYVRWYVSGWLDLELGNQAQ